MMAILTINVGSSSLRMAVYAVPDGRALAMAHLETNTGHGDAAALLQNFVAEARVGGIEAICHRIVHGGAHVTQFTRLDERVKAAINESAPLAPLHNPPALAWIDAASKAFPEAEQFAAFDTGLYAGLPDVAAHYAVPHDVSVRRLGFHGLAHQAMLHYLQALAPQDFAGKRVISLQLGSGCSATASVNGCALDTSMGYTPLEGLMMGTRSGDIDPGLLIHWAKDLGKSIEDIEALLTAKSGLLGVSGISSDMRELMAADDPRARLAVDMFCYRVRKYIGAYVAALGGLDAVLIGGGIGENMPAIRARILQPLGCFGIQLDEGLNDRAVGTTGPISQKDSPVGVHVVVVDENALMAQDTLKHLAAGNEGGQS
ncbi:MAG: acetate/propionate family kinase [Alphaproteobacteria bacterium]|nr:acetate/propionate family kinase [Alphaproteobacteria bacterium]